MSDAKTLNLTKTDLTQFLRFYLSKFPGYNSIKLDSGTNINTAMFINDDPAGLLQDINSKISMALNEYIETVFEEPAKKYNRNIVFYESEARGNVLFLRW